MVQKVAEILNINLIYLRPYCPDLSPIEDVWRVIKKTTYKSNYNSEKELIEIFKDKFYDIIENRSFYENWLDLNVINF
jgi:transposase